MEHRIDIHGQLDINYAKYRRLLMSALARLARAGYAIPPDEGLDLIHDFFVSEWNGIVERFDADRASFETYAFAAFLRFARPRIVGLNRLRDGLFEPAFLASLNVADPSDEERVAETDRMAVRRAAHRLEPSERALLVAYVGDDRPSERALARTLGISRYELRLKLADALGRLAVELGEVGALEARASAVAAALWRDNRTIRETAAVLRLSTSEVQDARAGLFGRLSRAVRGERTMTDIDVGSQEPERSSVDARALLAAALGVQATKDDFAALRANAAEVWAFLDGPTADEVLAEAVGLKPQQVEEIYSALADDGISIDEDPDYNAFVGASLLNDERIGEAFGSILMHNLANDLKQIKGRVFLGATPVEPRHRERLLGDPSVIAGGPAAAELTVFGLTPSLVMEAARAVSSLALRTCRENGIKRGGELVVDRSGGDVGRYARQEVLQRTVCIDEVQLTTRLPFATASRLFDWLCQVAGYAPLLFDGFDARMWGDELRLRRTDVAVSDVFRQLGSFPDTVIAA